MPEEIDLTPEEDALLGEVWDGLREGVISQSPRPSEGWTPVGAAFTPTSNTGFSPDQPRDRNGKWTSKGRRVRVDTPSKNLPEVEKQVEEFSRDVWAQALAGSLASTEALRRIREYKERVGYQKTIPDMKGLPTVYVHSVGDMESTSQPYHLPETARRLRISPEWRDLAKLVKGRHEHEEDDLLTAAAGLRPGAFLASAKRGLAKKVQILFDKYNLDAKAYEVNGPGVVVVRGDNTDHPDREKFVKLVEKQLTHGGYQRGDTRSTLTPDEHRLVGVWLGYPPERTEKYLKSGG
jgi:hypothetical protein